ncbi:hypothetical protein [Methanobacterium oryzae]|uniref:hypothetical protein n=1 Tax=Methanobacterium oryzae TaxID=69540 RepID=UPI003D1BD91A
MTIKDLTFQDGGDTYNGGAISNSGTLNIINCTFISNEADHDGGAIFNTGTLTVTDCTFTNNTATNYGGAIYNNNFGNCTVKDSNFTSNSAFDGGAILNHYYSNLSVINSNFTSNTADWAGGAIADASSLAVTNCIFINNTSNHGGGAIARDTSNIGIATGCTFINNTATNYGGAIWNYDGYFNIQFNRFIGNIASNGTAIYCRSGLVNTINNWWGSNNPDFSSLISGALAPTQWLFMTINATPSTINNTETSLITVSFNNYSSDGINYNPFDPATGHIPDGTLVTFNAERSIDGSSTTSGGVATATFTADGAPGEADVTAVTDSQTVNTAVTINAKSSLYLTVTPSKTNPVAGDTVVYTLKVGNNGPDTAENVVMTYVVPEGLEFVIASDDTGNTWTYDENTHTITWNLGSVPKGDPNLWLTLRVAQAGQYLINPTLSTSSYDPTLNNNVQKFAFTATAAQADGEPTNNTVNAASKTVTMQETGLPLPLIILAILMVLGGLIGTKRN